METQIEMAEYRCNTLKDQLDLMKETYGLKKQTKSRKISNISAEKKAMDDELEESSASSADIGKGKEKAVFPKKQISTAISTDNSGAAVRTINNILNGITNSVNRLSELQVQMSDSPKKSFGSKVSPHLVVNLVDFEENQPRSVKDLRAELQNPSIKVSTKSKNIKRKSKELKSQPIRRTAKNERRIKSSSNARVSSMVPGSNSIVSRAKLHHPPFPAKKPSGKIVELYHNLAAKNSDSDEATAMTSERHASDEKIPMSPIRETSAIKMPVPDDRRAREYRAKPQDTRQRMFRNVQVTCNQSDVADKSITYYTKNYELPTIASRMKQAAKCYLGPFSFKTIPFCAAISTSPSHNIGINIQQVMSILKTRQPLNGISPTLAHNIEMAANHLHSRPLSTLLTSINSRMSYKPSQCPLSKSLLNYQQLQEMARSIPEETAEELDDKVRDESPKTMVVTGPSGDVEVKARSGPIWAAESSQDNQCTCIQMSGVDLQQIVNKYKRNSTTVYTNTTPIQKNRVFPRTGKKVSRNELKRKNTATESRATTPLDNAESGNPLCGKEKNLKEVLMNLHDEFESLNKRYENLSQGGTGDDADTMKELEELETSLNKKEEEITMVMTLYKEVLALKQQIKALKEKASQASIQKRESKEENHFKDYTHPKAALHLTKLLRQIQMYQMKYKKSGAEM